MSMTGGCLCGAIRYRMSEKPDYASYCHCGMCRKATGAPFAGFVEAAGHIAWDPEPPAEFASSPGILRRFCRICGSALTFETDDIVFVTLGSLDKPEDVRVQCHTYTEFRLPDILISDDLPSHPDPAGGKGGRP